MAFFRNSTVNLLNLHYGLHAIAMYGGGAFYAVYLLKAGVPMALVLGALALILAGRFIIRPAIVPLSVRYGMRPLLIAGTLIAALQYPLLAMVDGVGVTLFALIFVAAVSDTFYWTTYHAYFATVGDQEHRGHQIGAREAIVAGVSIVSPIATGWMLVTVGPGAAFGVSAAAQVICAIPLLWTPNVAVAREKPGAFKAALPGVLLFVADGWIAIGYVFVWQLGMFLALGESFVAYGGALAIAGAVGAVCGLALGRFIDAGHGMRAVVLSVAVLAFVTLLRAAAVNDPVLAVIANALGAFVPTVYAPTLMTAVYNLAKAAPCTLRFHVATEGGWDAGGSAGCLTAAGLVALGVPLAICILLSLFGVVASFLLLRRYYASRSFA